MSEPSKEALEKARQLVDKCAARATVPTVLVACETCIAAAIDEARAEGKMMHVKDGSEIYERGKRDGAAEERQACAREVLVCGDWSICGHHQNCHKADAAAIRARGMKCAER
jgi:hypothetical protein